MKKKSLSIKQIFQQANKLMLILAILPLTISALLYSRQIFIYQKTVTNVQEANAIAAKVDETVLERMWDLVFGQITVSQYNRNTVVEELKADIHHIQENTTSNNEKNILKVALRILDTLEDYQQQIIENINLQDSVAKNEEIMYQVDNVTILLSDILQEFVRTEINLASQKNKEMYRSLFLLSVAEVLIIASIIYFVQKNRKFLDQKVQEPLNNLITMSNELSKGRLNYRLELPDTPELATLTASLNKMAADLSQLLEENALKQYHLAQSEVRVLQAQITPHFIYNSLDAILSLIEQQRYDEAKEMTFALSDFFRISLSKGKDWITIATEIRHVEDYLKILKIRYGEMLNYCIEVPEEIERFDILKMILQPIVENAVYHGTKFTRKVGKIDVQALEKENYLIFTVKDNGIGMTPERLKLVREELKKGIDADFSTGYGLSNVNKRLLLYYGSDAGLSIESTYRKGTAVIVTVPKIQGGTQKHV